MVLPCWCQHLVPGPCCRPPGPRGPFSREKRFGFSVSLVTFQRARPPGICPASSARPFLLTANRRRGTGTFQSAHFIVRNERGTFCKAPPCLPGLLQDSWEVEHQSLGRTAGCSSRSGFSFQECKRFWALDMGSFRFRVQGSVVRTHSSFSPANTRSTTCEQMGIFLPFPSKQFRPRCWEGFPPTDQDHGLDITHQGRTEELPQACTALLSWQLSAVFLLEHTKRRTHCHGNTITLYNSASKHVGRWSLEDGMVAELWQKETFPSALTSMWETRYRRYGAGLPLSPTAPGYPLLIPRSRGLSPPVVARSHEAL